MERYKAIVLSIGNLNKSIKRQECPGENEYIIIDKEVIFKDVTDIQTNQIILNKTSLKITKKIKQANAIIYSGKQIEFDATIENGKIIRIFNICGENPIGHDCKNNDKPFKLERKPGNIGCYECKHYDMKKDIHKKTCYKLNTWEK